MTASAALGSAPRLLELRLLDRDARLRVVAEDRDVALDFRLLERFLAPPVREVLLRDDPRLLRDEPALLRALLPRFRAELLRVRDELFLDELFLAELFLAELLRDAPRELRAPPLRPPVLRRLRPPELELFLPPLEPPRDDFLAAAMISAPIKKCQHRRQRHLL